MQTDRVLAPGVTADAASGAFFAPDSQVNGHPRPAPPRTRRKVHWESEIKLWAWIIFAKFPLGIVYLMVISEGLRQIIPPLGQRLWKIPFLSDLKLYEATYRLDLAHILALFLLVAVFWLAEKALLLWLDPRGAFADSVWPPEVLRMIVLPLCVVILGADACLFYCAIAAAGWGSATFSFSALLATAAYIAILVFITLVSITLKKTAQRG